MRSGIFNVAAILISGGAILFLVDLYFTNKDNSNFWSELMNPIALGLLVLPFVVSGVLMFLSRKEQERMAQISREYVRNKRKK